MALNPSRAPRNEAPLLPAAFVKPGTIRNGRGAGKNVQYVRLDFVIEYPGAQIYSDTPMSSWFTSQAIWAPLSWFESNRYPELMEAQPSREFMGSKLSRWTLTLAEVQLVNELKRLADNKATRRSLAATTTAESYSTDETSAMSSEGN